jgi:hypothetical protein
MGELPERTARIAGGTLEVPMFSIRKAIRTMREFMNAPAVYNEAPFSRDYPVARPSRRR